MGAKIASSYFARATPEATQTDITLDKQLTNTAGHIASNLVKLSLKGNPSFV